MVDTVVFDFEGLGLVVREQEWDARRPEVGLSSGRGAVGEVSGTRGRRLCGWSGAKAFVRVVEDMSTQKRGSR